MKDPRTVPAMSRDAAKMQAFEIALRVLISHVAVLVEKTGGRSDGYIARLHDGMQKQADALSNEHATPEQAEEFRAMVGQHIDDLLAGMDGF